MADLPGVLSQVLLPLGEMSLTAAYAAAVVAALRFLLRRRAPKQVLALLWLVVFARLLLPLSLESPVSIVPDALPRQEHVLPEAQLPPDLPPVPALTAAPVQPSAPALEDGAATLPAVQDDPLTSANPVPAITAPGGAAPAAPLPEAPAPFPWEAVLACVWLAGALVMGGSGLASYLRLRRRLYDAIRAPDGAWEHPSVASPFILGVFRPKIYLPAGLRGQPRQFILCHERAHLRRLDHIVKPVCWAALAIHWFNPAVWAAYLLMSRDIEAACDEAVIRQLGPGVKADYSATLLSLATGGRIPAPCPLSFDEGDAKGRIHNVLRYQRPALWIVVVSVIMAVMAAVCLLTDPVSAKTPEDEPVPSAAVSQPPESPLPTPSPEPTPAPAEPSPVLEDWMLEVLRGERTFRRTYGDGGEFTIHQLRTFFYGDPSEIQITITVGKFAILDLDGDGQNELIVFPAGEDQYLYSYVGYLILRQQGDEIAAYAPGWRSIGDLKADSTFHWSSSGFHTGIGRVRFTEDGGLEIEDITWFELHSEYDERYFVDGVQASREEFLAAQDAHDAKPEPVWYRWYEDTGLQRPVDVIQDQSTYTPRMLGDGMRALYRQASTLYSHLFGESTAEICWMKSTSYWSSGLYDPADAIERDGLTYLRATGQFARWDDLMAAVDGLFTRDFWNACNQWDGHELFINVDGDTYFLPASRPKGDQYGAKAAPFTLVAQTENTVELILTNRYWRPRGEDEVAWSQRTTSSYCDYTMDYPIRYVNTADGWRLDEFHYGWTDQREYVLGHILWETEPRAALNGEMDAATLRQLGTQTLLDWGGTTYQIDSDVNAATFTGRMYVLDVDGDGQTEASLVYLDGGDPIIAVYERTETGLQRRTFHTAQLAQSFNDYAQVERNDRGGITITHSAPREITTIELSAQVFEGHEWLREGELRAVMDPEYLYVGLDSESPLTPPFGIGTFISLTDSVGNAVYVASAGFQVEYDGGGSLYTGRLWAEPYSEFAVPAS